VVRRQHRSEREQARVITSSLERERAVHHAPCLGAAYVRASIHAGVHTLIHMDITVFETTLQGDLRHYTELVKVEMFPNSFFAILRISFTFLFDINLDKKQYICNLIEINMN
jgi:hypothetical protein